MWFLWSVQPEHPVFCPHVAQSPVSVARRHPHCPSSIQSETSFLDVHWCGQSLSACGCRSSLCVCVRQARWRLSLLRSVIAPSSPPRVSPASGADAERDSKLRRPVFLSKCAWQTVNRHSPSGPRGSPSKKAEWAVSSVSARTSRGVLCSQSCWRGPTTHSFIALVINMH